MTRLGAALLGVFLGAALLLSGGHLQAQEPNNSGRLQLHGELRLHYDTQQWEHVDAVCDTGNGTMLYLIQGGGRARAEAVPVLGGCQKAQGEK